VEGRQADGGERLGDKLDAGRAAGGPKGGRHTAPVKRRSNGAAQPPARGRTVDALVAPAPHRQPVLQDVQGLGELRVDEHAGEGAERVCVGGEGVEHHSERGRAERAKPLGVRCGTASRARRLRQATGDNPLPSVGASPVAALLEADHHLVQQLELAAGRDEVLQRGVLWGGGWGVCACEGAGPEEEVNG
jgi:hypothetical protein